MCAPVLYKKQMECTTAKCLRTIDIKVREWIWIPAPVLTRMWPYVTKLLCLYFLIYKMEIIRGVLWRLNESVFEKSSALCKTSCYHHHHCDPHHNHHFTGRDTEDLREKRLIIMRAIVFVGKHFAANAESLWDDWKAALKINTVLCHSIPLE